MARLWQGPAMISSRYHDVNITTVLGGPVPDILIRDVPDEVVLMLEQRARHLGLSRTEYLRRVLARESADRTTDATLDDWRAFAQRHCDLDDPEIMGQAWR